MGLTMLLILSTRCDVFCVQKGFDGGEYRAPNCACVTLIPERKTREKPLSVPREGPAHRIDETWNWEP
jgi:hypothetical protein